MSPFSTIVADMSSQFSTSQLCNMIVLAAPQMGTLFDRQIVLSVREEMVKENPLNAEVDFSNFKYSY